MYSHIGVCMILTLKSCDPVHFGILHVIYTHYSILCFDNMYYLPIHVLHSNTWCKYKYRYKHPIPWYSALCLPIQVGFTETQPEEVSITVLQYWYVHKWKYSYAYRFVILEFSSSVIGCLCVFKVKPYIVHRTVLRLHVPLTKIRTTALAPCTMGSFNGFGSDEHCLNCSCVSGFTVFQV